MITIVGDEYIRNVGRTIRVNVQVLKKFFVGISLVDFHANIKPRLAKAVDVTVEDSNAIGKAKGKLQEFG